MLAAGKEIASPAADMIGTNLVKKILQHSQHPASKLGSSSTQGVGISGKLSP